MLNHLDNFFLTLDEPEQGCLLFIRQFILNYSNKFSEHWKYNTPFYHFNGKWFCYLSYHKKTKRIYIGFVYGYKLNHPKLLSEGRKQIKVFYIDAAKDVDIKSLKAIMKEACAVYEK